LPVRLVELEWVEVTAAALSASLPLKERRSGRARRHPFERIWFDTADASVEAAGLELVVEHQAKLIGQALYRSAPGLQRPGVPLERVDETEVATARPEPASLPELASLDPDLLPLSAWTGTELCLSVQGGAAPLSVSLAEGILRSVSAEEPCNRLTIGGLATDREAAWQLARRLAEVAPVRIACCSIGARARALALGQAAPPPGPPVIPAPAEALGPGFAAVAGSLLLAMLREVDGVRNGTATEPVHRMRVAMRRLRSAMQIFRPALGGPHYAEIEAGLRELGRALGPARDWDVFLNDTLPPILVELGEDPRLRRLERRAREARGDAYAHLRAMLAAPPFRLLGIDLARHLATEAWRTETPGFDPERSETLEGYGRAILDRRRKRVRKVGKRIDDLDPTALHELRLDGKRLRYAGEFFSVLGKSDDARKYLKQLAGVQDLLGTVNDAHVAQDLLGTLSDRGWASGVVQGWTRARAAAARSKAEAAFLDFAKRDPFWRR